MFGSPNIVQSICLYLPMFITAEVAFQTARANAHLEADLEYNPTPTIQKNTAISLIVILGIAKHQSGQVNLFIKNHQITQQQETLRTVLSNMPDGIVIVKKPTKSPEHDDITQGLPKAPEIKFCNQAMTKLF